MACVENMPDIGFRIDDVSRLPGGTRLRKDKGAQFEVLYVFWRDTLTVIDQLLEEGNLVCP